VTDASALRQDKDTPQRDEADETEDCARADRALGSGLVN
jgi:hypothetical protein